MLLTIIKLHPLVISTDGQAFHFESTTFPPSIAASNGLKHCSWEIEPSVGAFQQEKGNY